MYQLGRIIGYLVKWSLYGYIYFDIYVKITKSESFVTNIIALVALLIYTALVHIGGLLLEISHAANFLAVTKDKEMTKQEEIKGFEKLLNDFGNSDWTLDKD